MANEPVLEPFADKWGSYQQKILLLIKICVSLHRNWLRR